MQTTPDDLIAVAHFQSVALNMHLADGDMRLAIQSGIIRSSSSVPSVLYCCGLLHYKGKSAMLMAAALHDIKVPLTVLPLYFHVVLAESMYGGVLIEEESSDRLLCAGMTRLTRLLCDCAIYGWRTTRGLRARGILLAAWSFISLLVTFE